METLDLSRRGVLLNDEQLGPYPLKKLERVERLTVDIVEDSPRMGKKEMASTKCRPGGFGDTLKRRMKDFTVRVSIGASYYHFQKYLNSYPESEVTPEKAPLLKDTYIVTRHIKKMACFTGTEMVGMCEVPRDVYYVTRVGGTPVERFYRYAVVFLVYTQLSTIVAPHGDEWPDDTVAYQAYQRLVCMSNTLVDYIRRLGRPARNDAFNNYMTIMPRLVALVGPEEFSRLGIVVSPSMGAAFKAAAVLTDLSLMLDGPIDFGLQNYCSVCKICVGQCSMCAIPTGEQEEHRGYMLWRTDERRCVVHGAADPHGHTCGCCAKVCPFIRSDCGPECFQDWDGGLSVFYRSAGARRKFLASHGYVGPEEEHGKWWLPHVVRDGKIRYGGDLDYEVQRRHMERTRQAAWPGQRKRTTMARTIDPEERKQLRVLLNPVRQDITHLLRRAGRPMATNTVAEKMLLSPGAAQSHLNKLEELGMVELGVYTAPDGRQATYYWLANVEIRLCLGRKDGFQGEREALAVQLVDGTFRGVLHAAGQYGGPEQQEDFQFLFSVLHPEPEERAESLGLIDGYLRTYSVSEGGVGHWEYVFMAHRAGEE